MSTTKSVTLATIALLSLSVTGCSSSSEGAVASDCSPAHSFSTLTEGTLTVGVTDMPPSVSSVGDKGMSGIDADLIALFAESECLTVTVQIGNSATMVAGVEQGRTDTALGGWNRTVERSKVVALSDPLYIDPLGIVTVDGIDSFAKLEGKTIGTVDGYNYVPSLQAVFGDRLKLYPTPLNMSQDLEAGRIDAAVDGFNMVPFIYDLDSFKVSMAQPDDRFPATVEPAQGALVFSLDNTELVEAFNEFLAQARADGSFAEILERNDVSVEILEVGEPRLM